MIFGCASAFMTLNHKTNPVCAGNNVVLNCDIFTNFFLKEVIATYNSTLFILYFIHSTQSCSISDVTNNVSVKSNVVRGTNIDSDWSEVVQDIVLHQNVL